MLAGFTWWPDTENILTVFIEMLKKLGKGRERKILKIYWNKHHVMNNMQFLLGTYLWDRSLFIMAWKRQWKCTGCGTNDTCMNGQSVSEIWSRMILYMGLPFSEENPVRLTADVLLNSCLCAYWPFITYELSRKITEMAELSWLVLIAGESKVRSLRSHLTMAFCIIVGNVLDFCI